MIISGLCRFGRLGWPAALAGVAQPAIAPPRRQAVRSRARRAGVGWCRDAARPRSAPALLAGSRRSRPGAARPGAGWVTPIERAAASGLTLPNQPIDLAQLGHDLFRPVPLASHPPLHDLTPSHKGRITSTKSDQSGVRVGRGSVIPEWVNVAPMRNVSIRRLRPGASYGYFVSLDNKVVVIEPGSRRIARVIRRTA